MPDRLPSRGLEASCPDSSNAPVRCGIWDSLPHQPEHGSSAPTSVMLGDKGCFLSHGISPEHCRIMKIGLREKAIGVDGLPALFHKI